DTEVNLHGVTPNWSLYFTDTLTLPKNVNVTVSGRYNRATVHNTDLLDPEPGPGSLTGDYVFQRFNPAVGVTWSPTSSVNLYARASPGRPVAAAMALGVAGPGGTGSWPRESASAAPPKPVVTETGGSGMRGRASISSSILALCSAIAFLSGNPLPAVMIELF